MYIYGSIKKSRENIMKKNKAVIVLGILFGLGLIVVGVLYFVLAIALAFAGYGWFVNVSFGMLPLALCAIVGACFARVKILVSRITLGVSILGYIASVVTLLLIPNVSVGGYLIPFAILVVLGVVALVLSFVAKTPKKVVATNPPLATDSNPPVSE